MSITDNSRLTWPGRSDSPIQADPSLPVIARCEHHRVGQPSTTTRLIHGDNLCVLQRLVAEQPKSVACIYIDPPFGIGTVFRTSHATGTRDTTTSDPIAYRDQWSGGIEGYLSFGPENFRNEILWRRAPNLGKQAASNQLGRTFESILLFSRNPGKALRGGHPEITTPYPLTRAGHPKGCFFDELRACWYTTAPRGDYTDDSIARLEADGRIHRSASGTVYIKYFLEQAADGCWVKRQRVDTLWDDSAVRPLRHRPKSEDMGYDTQKPEGLLERIVSWATLPGDTVLDAFNGSGTTITVASKLGRNAIGIDVGDASISITRRRLREIPNVEFTIDALHQVPEKACNSELQATFKSIGESTVQVDISGPNVQEVTAWGVGYDVNGVWECLWYSGILRSSEVAKSIEINISSDIAPDRLIVHVETQKDQTRLSVTPSPEMP